MGDVPCLGDDCGKSETLQEHKAVEKKKEPKADKEAKGVTRAVATNMKEKPGGGKRKEAGKKKCQGH